MKDANRPVHGKQSEIRRAKAKQQLAVTWFGKQVKFDLVLQLWMMDQAGSKDSSSLRQR